MKLIKINPKHIFRSRKTPSVSRSEPLSFGSVTSSSSSSDSSEESQKPDKGKNINGYATPTSVLPAARSHSGAGEWSEISEDTYYDLVQGFKLIDQDGDGKITASELVALLSRVGGAEPPGEDELLMMLSEVDRDGDGSISLEEFGAISSAFGPPACDSELREAFNFFDADRDGRITAEELHGVFEALGDERCTLEDCRRMIRGVDKNGDGFVCFEDFTRMMVQHR